MLLISHFWHALLLVNLLTSPSNGDGRNGFTQSCWKVEANQKYDNLEECEPKIGQGGSPTCKLDKRTGLGLGCVADKDVAIHCRPATLHRHFIYCDIDAEYCCCQGGLCNGLYFKSMAKKQACEQPQLEKSEVCKPPISCLKPGTPVPEKCGISPVGQPYCKLDPKTGDPMGCGDAYPMDKDECKTLNPTGAMLICNHKLCCCKGTPGGDNMPCNRLTMEACKIKELAGLDKCKDPTKLPMMNETHPFSSGSTADSAGMTPEQAAEMLEDLLMGILDWGKLLSTGLDLFFNN